MMYRSTDRRKSTIEICTTRSLIWIGIVREMVEREGWNGKKRRGVSLSDELLFPCEFISKAILHESFHCAAKIHSGLVVTRVTGFAENYVVFLFGCIFFIYFLLVKISYILYFLCRLYIIEYSGKREIINTYTHIYILI